MFADALFSESTVVSVLADELRLRIEHEVRESGRGLYQFQLDLIADRSVLYSGLLTAFHVEHSRSDCDWDSAFDILSHALSHRPEGNIMLSVTNLTQLGGGPFQLVVDLIEFVVELAHTLRNTVRTPPGHRVALRSVLYGVGPLFGTDLMLASELP